MCNCGHTEHVTVYVIRHLKVTVRSASSQNLSQAHVLHSLAKIRAGFVNAFWMLFGPDMLALICLSYMHFFLFLVFIFFYFLVLGFLNDANEKIVNAVNSFFFGEHKKSVRKCKGKHFLYLFHVYGCRCELFVWTIHPEGYETCDCGWIVPLQILFSISNIIYVCNTISYAFAATATFTTRSSDYRVSYQMSVLLFIRVDFDDLIDLWSIAVQWSLGVCISKFGLGQYNVLNN